MTPPDVSIIVPTYCEAPNIRPLTERTCAALAKAGLSGEIVFADDRSPDGTADAVRALQSEFPVRVIERDGIRSLAAAVLDGFAAARGEVFVVMDADLSHPPEVLADIVRPIADNKADMVIGSRYVERGATMHWPWWRRLNSAVATWLAAPLVRRAAVHDPMSGYFCLHRRTWQAARDLSPIGYKIGLELLVKADCRRIVEVPITFADRAAGRSKLTAREQMRYLRHLRRLYAFRWPRATAGALVAAVVVVLLALAGLVYGIARGVAAV